LDAARELLGGSAALTGIEALKFKRLLRPADVFHLRVELSPDRTAVAFRLWDDASVFSSARLRFRPNPGGPRRGAPVRVEPRFDETAPKNRLYGRRLSQLIVWGYTGSFAVRDPLCGFRCFPLAPTVGLLDRYRLGDRMDFDPEIVVRLAWEGVPIVNVPVRVRYFPQGRSHFRLIRD